ncbi:MAG TPA: permease-like cell division protein FtsX [Thermoclostridium caenicola]|uniref:Cell division protein FtsX n=1 Tax=Thermoclostridium caenicola TaxID=659425 RepID=A0A1M6BM57_9FIRM|nr:permease-like cell division protein FtsX [Thermoclostridium caenicola]SHI49819.1 cell division transport system permease protein [Thermoclostridium caenicola]HOK42834.1 permease-like cell division protein FtsX [Thermoclostridium caenicola]HOL84903.1 permease-like cell division protein FtsX [Thermoclostridium caenicola]HOP71744.1 permease-like cell division protein FtsX [Thermoclostridium caenicola]HPO77357.1 permease-like cell division protein FtsX [Thermoclostridium caenicola]
MKIRTLRLLAKEGTKNVYKNKLMSFASLATILATLFVLGLVLLIIVNVTTNLEAKKQDLQVKFYLRVDATRLEEEEVALFIEQSRASGVVAEYQYESREQAYENAKKDLKYEALMEGLTPENFAVGYFVTLTNPNDSDQFIARLKLFSGVDSQWITYPKQELERISGMVRVFNYVALFVIAVLMVISILLISNTIRLTVFARRKEIEIMKYVGANDWFIRFPFIIEGMLIGLLGALLSHLLTSQAYGWIKDGLNTLFNSIKISGLQLVEFGELSIRILVVNVLFGVTIGIIGSFMSVKKHLNV